MTALNTMNIKRLRILAIWCSLGWMLSPARAHDPLDSSTRLVVLADQIRIESTLGADAARAFLQAARLPATEVAKLTRATAPFKPIPVAKDLAPRLFEATAGAERLEASHFTVQPMEEDIIFVVFYPRPAGDKVALRAAYFDETKDLRPGVFVAIDEKRTKLLTILLSPQKTSFELPLRAPPSPVSAK